jgi:hypothetical protein
MIRAIAYAVAKRGNVLVDKAISCRGLDAKWQSDHRRTLTRRFGVIRRSDLLSLEPSPLRKSDISAFPPKEASRLKAHLHNSELVSVELEFVPDLGDQEWARLERSQDIYLQFWAGEAMKKEVRIYPTHDLSMLELYLGLPLEVLLTKSRMLNRSSRPEFLTPKLKWARYEVSIDSRIRES